MDPTVHNSSLAVRLIDAKVPSVKTIVYLDQPFVSSFWKSQQKPYRVDPIWSDLYGLLRRAVKDDRVICPASPFHDEEDSLTSTLAVGIHEVSIELSWGLNFLHWNEILDNQAKRALYRYAGAPLEDPEWKDAFDTNPHEPLAERSVEFRGSRLLIDAFMARPSEFITEHRATKEAYVKDLVTPTPARERRTFDEQLKREKQSFIWERFVQPSINLREHLTQGAFPSLVDLENSEALRFLALDSEKLGLELPEPLKFLTSDALFETPFIDVFCSIYAAMRFYLPNRKPRASDLDDVAILATVLPYCDVVTTDKGMKDICIRAGLHTKYGVETYFPQPEDVRALVARIKAS